jgi:hypothetical protein
VSRPEIDEQAVFLNFPFNRSYEPVFLGIVAGLVSLQLKPRCVIEIPDLGQGRMDRLYQLIASCRTSIHDLSCVGLPVRFNMPFELGIAYALKQKNDAYQFVIFERKRYRFERTLTDLKMIDAKIHGGSGLKALRCVYECFVPPGRSAPSDLGRKIYARLVRSRNSNRASRDMFNRTSFDEIISIASLLATSLDA